MIDLHYVDELIRVRAMQHGGARGAPLIVGGHRVGTSINRSCIVMLSALLQSHVEDVFKDSARRAFPRLDDDADAFEAYWKQMKNWGNPSGDNIKNLYLKLGVPNVLETLSWRGLSSSSVIKKLNDLNQIRNQIAHGGRSRLQLKDQNGRQQAYSLTLAKVSGFREFAFNFGNRFSRHVLPLVQARV
jgi:hypothetical protein